MACKGICYEFEAKKINLKGSGMYQTGHKRCSECEKFILWDEIRCPCCGTRLRLKPRQSNLRKKWIK